MALSGMETVKEPDSGKACLQKYFALFKMCQVAHRLT